MLFDHKLWFDCECAGTGERIHKLVNKMSIYKGHFHIAQITNWEAKWVLLARRAEEELRIELFKVRNGEFNGEVPSLTANQMAL